MSTDAAPVLPPATGRSPGSTGRRLGYLVGALVNLVLLFLVNRWPGWQAVPFLTDEAADLIPLLNAALWFGVGSNLVLAAWSPPWLRALVDLVSTSFSLAVLLRLARTMPFDFAGTTVDWTPWVQFGLWFLVAASGIALLVQLVRFLRALVLPGPPAR